LTRPDPPLALSEVPSITLANQIGLTWNEGSDNGGSPVIDYVVSYKAQEALDYFTEQNVVETSLTLVGLS